MDYYHDLTVAQFSHLELPLPVSLSAIDHNGPHSAESVETLLSLLTCGIECTRHPSRPHLEVEGSDIRGGCTLVNDPEMLLEVAVGSPRLYRHRFTRRSDMIWAALSRVRHGRKSLLLPSFVVSHDRRSSRSKLDPQNAIETLIDDILGSAVYRDVSGDHSFLSFAKERLVRAKASIFRVNGLLETLESQIGPLPSLLDLRQIYENEVWMDSLNDVISSLREGEEALRAWKSTHWSPSPDTISSLREMGDFAFLAHRLQSARPANDDGTATYLGHGDEGVVWQVSVDRAVKVFDRADLTPAPIAILERLSSITKEERLAFSCLNLPLSVTVREVSSPLLRDGAPFPGSLTPEQATLGMIELVRQCRALSIICNNLTLQNLFVPSPSESTSSSSPPTSSFPLPILFDWGRDIVQWTERGEELMLRRIFLILRWSHRDDLKKLMTKSRKEPVRMAELAGFSYLKEALSFRAELMPTLSPAAVDLTQFSRLEEALALISSLPTDTRYVFWNEAFVAAPFSLRKLLRASKRFVETREDIRTIRTSDLLPFSSHELLRFRSMPRRDVSVGIIIRTCAMEHRTLYASVIHIISQIEGRKEHADDRVILIDSRRSHFLREYCSPDLDAVRSICHQLLSEGWVDRVVESASSPDHIHTVYRRWFGEGCEWRESHSPEGHHVIPGLESLNFDCDLVLQCDSDIIISRVDPEHCILQEASEVFANDPQVVTWSLNVYHDRPRIHSRAPPLPFSWPHRVESRASFFHLPRLRSILPLQLPSAMLSEKSPPRGWQRLLDLGLSMTAPLLKSVRGGSPNLFHVHPSNELKTPRRLRELGYVVGALEAGGTPPLIQSGKSSFQLKDTASIEKWVGSTVLESLGSRPPKVGGGTHFVVVICGWDGVDPGVALACIESLRSQSYQNWHAIAILDSSFPRNEERKQWLRRLLLSDDRISLLQPTFRGGSLSNTWIAIRRSLDSTYADSVIVTLDVDDMFANEDVLSLLARMYDDHPSLDLAVGGMTRTDRPLTIPLPISFLNARRLRGGGNVWQHLRSFKKSLFDRIRWEDLVDKETELPYDLAADWAYMLPLAELARLALPITFPSLLYRAPLKSKRREEERERTIARIVSQPAYFRPPYNVGVIGHSTLVERDHPLRDLSERIGSALTRAGFNVLTGGLGGVMEAAARGVQLARSEGGVGQAIGVLPGTDSNESNPFLNVVVPTSLDQARNALIAQSDAIVVIGGGAGTLSEVSLAWSYRRLVIAMVGSGGTADKVAGTKIDERKRYPNLNRDCVYPAPSVDALVQLLRDLLPLYRHRKSIQSRL